MNTPDIDSIVVCRLTGWSRWARKKPIPNDNRPPVCIAALACLLLPVVAAPGETWTPTSAPVGPWRALASSADGNKLVAAGARYTDFGLWKRFGIYTSTDSGATWTQTSAPSNAWVSVASSADGSRLVAVATVACPYGPEGNCELSLPGVASIYTSADSGATWTRTSAPTNRWSSVASSADGNNLVASCPDGLYISLDAGATWNSYVTATNLSSPLAMSSAGTKIFALGPPALIYVSTNAGATWNPTSAVSTNSWSSIACSADGTRIVAAAGARDVTGGGLDGPVFISTDAGVTWNQTPLIGSTVSCSADGIGIVVGASESLYASSDVGKTWRHTWFYYDSWWALACSADGTKVIAASSDGLIYSSAPYRGPWKAAEVPAFDWSDVAISGSGTKLAALYSLGMYVSTNSGTNWSPASELGIPNSRWELVRASADGRKLVAAADKTWINTSADWGTTWHRTSAPGYLLSSGAISADGTKLLFGTESVEVGTGPIFTSTDLGVNWTQTSAPTNTWASVACSADATKIVAAGEWPGVGGIYVSADSGETWRYSLASTNYDSWVSMASSADGSTLLAAPNGNVGSLFTSLDSGMTWTEASLSGNVWASTASSADGTRLVAAAAGGDRGHGGSIYLSDDGGVSWSRANSPDAAWRSVAVSQDGKMLVAVAMDDGNGNAGGIYTLRFPLEPRPAPEPPQLAINISAQNVAISWLIPSTSFVLQQNPDLGKANWTDVPNPSTLNFTNLHYEAVMPPGGAGRFFRLRQR